MVCSASKHVELLEALLLSVLMVCSASKHVELLEALLLSVLWSAQLLSL